jgi:putative ABC transport system substrate-binding protein
MAIHIRRREFIFTLGGAAAAWPLAARAEQPERKRRLGLLTGLSKNDLFATTDHVRQLRQALEALGWIEGRNVEFIYRYAEGSPERARLLAEELIEIRPDLVVAHTTPAAAALHRASRTVPIIFVSITDPVAGGFVANLARPGGNMTGFTNYEYSMGAKWLELHKEIAPGIARVALMLNPDTGPYYVEYLRSVETVALAMFVQATLSPVRSAEEIERTITALGREPGGGLIILPSAPITSHRAQIIELAARHRVPAIFPFVSYAREGGLAAYGVDVNDLFRRAASYVDRVLKGERPADLPVQAPTRFALVINLKTARALALEIPPTLLARADEVIE